MARTIFALTLLLLLAACGDEPSATPDLGALDAGPVDAGEADAGLADAGTVDAATDDAGTADAATDDAGGDDAGPADAGSSDAGAPTLGLITPTELHAALVTKDFLMIDVHIPYAGVVPGTDTSIAYTNVDGLVGYIGPNLDTRVVLTCYSGGMSSVAGAALVARGYRAVRHLQGGMAAWVAAGYTLTP
jgi:rhodanese-related sulfurtransferase